MCPTGYRFLRECTWRTITQRTSAIANEVVNVPGAPERVGFGVYSRGQTVWCGPRVEAFVPIAVARNAFSSWGIGALTVVEFGPLIVYPWRFELVDAGGEYLIGEWLTKPDFQ